MEDFIMQETENNKLHFGPPSVFCCFDNWLISTVIFNILHDGKEPGRNCDPLQVQVSYCMFTTTNTFMTVQSNMVPVQCTLVSFVLFAIHLGAALSLQHSCLKATVAFIGSTDRMS